MPAPGHQPVLLQEVIELLAPASGETLLDCTIGRAGHAESIGGILGPQGHLLGLDLDPQNLDFAQKRLLGLSTGPEVRLHHENFVGGPQRLGQVGWRADLVLADLGFSSNQMGDAERGFSFRVDGPLDMRLNPTTGPTAADLVNTLSEPELADIIYQYGEDPFARRIAKKLVESRRVSSISTTSALASLVRDAYGHKARASRMHPATRTFMALRIVVNDELGALRALLDSMGREAERIGQAGDAKAGADGWLNPGARLGVISFHSLEDRMVKHQFTEMARSGVGAVLTRKPVEATPEEVAGNPRARSAKLRVFRLGGSHT